MNAKKPTVDDKKATTIVANDPDATLCTTSPMQIQLLSCL